jgi:hypothetical protein
MKETDVNHFILRKKKPEVERPSAQNCRKGLIIS